MLLIGIDEAGYGPVLGPLCHGFSAFRLPNDARMSPPDLWTLLHPTVTRAGGGGEIEIDDSKKLHARSDGLTALETGVRAFYKYTYDARFFCQAFGLDALISRRDFDELAKDCWVDVDSVDSHTGSTANLTYHHAGCLRESLDKLRGNVVAIGARAMSARAFNSALDGGGNKADVSWRVFGPELKRLAALSEPNEPVFAAIDRQGGRKFYAGLLSELFETPLVQVERETSKESIYCIEVEARIVRVGFYVGGDALHFPIALASMAAKLAREKYMLRFNAFFRQHLPELKPTAGYYTDAQRFLKETKALRAKLGIADADLIRAK